jgi:hypothetical protein
MTMHIIEVQVPWWRVARPRWVWMGVGALWGFTLGFSLGVII